MNYLSTGGGGIGGFSAGEMSSLVTTVQDSLVISYTNGSGVSVTIAKLRYNTASSFLASLTFTLPSGVTAIKAEFVPGNTSTALGYGYFVDNLRLARMTGAGFYMSNFVTTSISASNTDGWSTNWATSYMNVLAGPPNKLRASGQSPNISRNFTVTPNDACAFSYTQTENNSVSLVIEQSPNGTSGWSTLMNITSVNGTHVRNFTPTQAYVRVRMSGSAAFSLADVMLKSTHVDRTVVEIPGKSRYRYGYQGSEMDNEVKGSGNSYTTEFRQLDPRLGRWLSIDPKATSMPWQSPYCSMDNNPIWFNDPLGDSTFVTKLGDGKYKVIGGNLAGDHNGIFVRNEDNSIGEMIGYSLTPQSFYNPDKANESERWMGTIDVNDQSGRAFMNDIQINFPGDAKYIANATGGKKYDFKRTNGGDNVLYDTDEEYYRGMPVMKPIHNQTVFASARDLGNVAAGYVAGRMGNNWMMSRAAFDALESYQQGKLSVETSSTQYAEFLGYALGNWVAVNEIKHFSQHSPQLNGDHSGPKKLPKTILMKKNGPKAFY